MVTNSSKPDTKVIKTQDVLFMVLISLFLGVLGGLVNKSVTAIIWAIILVGIWRAYSHVTMKSRAILSGLLVSGGLGTVVGTVGWLLGGSIYDVGSGALFGLGRGVLIGTAVGIVTRANSEESDTQQTKFLIIGGSILLGIVLGGLVGLTAGIILGLIGDGISGAIGATIAGSILGASIGTYFKEVRWIAVTATILAILAAMSVLLGGAVAGIVVGAISGSFAPILLVSSIGAFGGLTGRGLKAMIIEALEAPIEMMEQAAVPFLVPALVIGMIVGAVSVGAAGILALTITFALLGLFLGIMGELLGNRSKVTIRSMIEAAMLGAETWPIRRVIRIVANEPKRAAIGAGIGASVALVGGLGGVWLAQLILNIMPTAL